MSNWVVLEFSLATATHSQTIAGIVEERIAEGLRPLLVIQAPDEAVAALEDLLASRGLPAARLSASWFDEPDQATRRTLAALPEPVVLTPAVPAGPSFEGGSSLTAAFLAAAAALVVAASLALWHLVEKPALRPSSHYRKVAR